MSAAGECRDLSTVTSLHRHINANELPKRFDATPWIPVRPLTTNAFPGNACPSLYGGAGCSGSREAAPNFLDVERNFSQSDSGRTFDYLFYFGIIRGMMFLILADDYPGFRFYLSPAGAGPSILPGAVEPGLEFFLVREGIDGGRAAGAARAGGV